MLLFQKQDASPVTEEDALYVDFTMSLDHVLPIKSTVYQCRIIEIPQLQNKHHVIKVIAAYIIFFSWEIFYLDNLALVASSFRFLLENS